MQIDSAHQRFAAAAGAAAPTPARAGAVARTPDPPRAASGMPVDTVELSVAATPPPDVLQEIAAAAERAHELAQANRELHFRPDEHSNRIIIEVRDMSGNVIRTIPPSKALDVMTAPAGRESQWLA